jgi:hypothetical protein
VKRIEKQYLETEGFMYLEVDRLIIIAGGSASDSSNSSDVELEDDVDSVNQLSGIENLA